METRNKKPDLEVLVANWEDIWKLAANWEAIWKLAANWEDNLEVTESSEVYFEKVKFGSSESWRG